MDSLYIHLLILTLLQNTLCSYVLLSHHLQNSHIKKTDDSEQCKPITIPACKKLGYNSTRLPRLKSFGENDITRYLEIFEKERCSADLLFFTCMMYNPICFKQHIKRVLPCKSVCQNVKRDCRKAMKKLQIDWPRGLDCDQLPDYETDVCIKPKSIVTRNRFTSQTFDKEDTQKKPCPTCPERPRLQRYRQFRKSNYAIEAQYISKTVTADGNLKLHFKIHKVFKAGEINLVKHGTVDIWSYSPCLCVNLEYDEKYFILGRESKTNGSRRIVLNRKTIVMKKNLYLKRRLKKWKRKYREIIKRKVEVLRILNYDQPMYPVPSNLI